MPSKRPVAFFEPLEARTLFSAQTPFTGTPVALPGTIEAENYDKGGSGVAYHDTTGGNSGGEYRSDDVDIAAGGSNGFHVTNIAAGEWLEYTVNITTPGTYSIAITYSSTTSGGQVHVSFDGTNKTGWIGLNNTGSDSTWKTVTKSGVNLAGGTHVMRLMVDQANTAGQLVGNIDSIKFTRTSSTSSAGDFNTNPLVWKKVASNPVEREEAQSLVYNGKLYELGGFTGDGFTATTQVDVYDPNTNKWTRIKDMPAPITHAAVVPDPDGHTFWFIGGFLGSFKHPNSGPVPPPATTDVFKFDAATDTWSRGTSLPTLRGAGGAGVVNDKIYFFGGYDTATAQDVASTWVLDLGNQSAGWKSTGASVPNPRNHLGGIVVNGMIYAIGGQHHIQTASVMQSEVDRYDPVTNTWTKVASLPVALSHYNASTVLYNRYIITVGGENPHDVAQPYVFAYDTVLNKWARLTNLPDPRRAGVAGVIGNELIQSTGYDRPEAETATTYETDLSNVFW